MGRSIAAVVLVPLSHFGRRLANLDLQPFDVSASTRTPLESEMKTLRQTIVSLAVLAAFMLVLAAPFRWWCW
jgi:hypothetical protein